MKDADDSDNMMNDDSDVMITIAVTLTGNEDIGDSSKVMMMLKYYY